MSGERYPTDLFREVRDQILGELARRRRLLVGFDTESSHTYLSAIPNPLNPRRSYRDEMSRDIISGSASRAPPRSFVSEERRRRPHEQQITGSEGSTTRGKHHPRPEHAITTAGVVKPTASRPNLLGIVELQPELFAFYLKK